MKITIDDLINADACQEQQREFRHRFGDETEVTLELGVKYVDEFDWGFAGRYMLPLEKRAIFTEKYEEICKVDNEATAPYFSEYRETISRINAERDSGAITFKEHDDLYMEAWNKRNAATHEHWNKRSMDHMKLFVEMWNEGE